jgi:hypothetical protein
LRNTKTTALSIAAIAAVAILAVGVATTVSGVPSAYASTKQAKIELENECGVDDSSHVHNDRTTCTIRAQDLDAN